MEIIPAIDIKDGRCVRLYKGDFEQETVYGNPVEMASLWASKGASRLHIVDLDGALQGEPGNLDLISQIIDTVDIPIQVGGGVRNLETIESYLEIGVGRVIIGTAAVKNPELVVEAVNQFGSEQIVVGIDAKDGMVATEGWLESSDTSVVQLGLEMKERGVEWVVYTDIDKDGTLAGPNIAATRRLASQTGLKVIASGGVSDIDDIKNLMELEEDGVVAAITGKALYSGSLNLEEITNLKNI